MYKAAVTRMHRCKNEMEVVDPLTTEPSTSRIREEKGTVSDDDERFLVGSNMKNKQFFFLKVTNVCVCLSVVAKRLHT
jgi:hypothetical protein